jgi:glycosyltransferase involved in cell wall biosynthesis
MNNPPKVCICIPCYNNQDTIEETLTSIIQQDYPEIKIKIFDNASSDDTRKIVQRFLDVDRNIELHTRNETVSGEENFNTCIEYAEGEFSAIFHADDIYTKSMIKEQVQFLLDYKECGAVATHARIIDEKSNIIGERFVPNELRKKGAFELQRKALVELSFKYGNFITCPSVLFRTTILKEHIKRFLGKDFRSSSDLNVWFRVTEQGTLGFINKPLISYRESTASFSFNLARARTEEHDMFLVLDDLLNHNDFSDQFIDELMRHRSFLIMKDSSNININRLILGKKKFVGVNLLSNVRQAFRSVFHLKFFSIALVVKIIVHIPLKYFSSRMLKRAKHGKG